MILEIDVCDNCDQHMKDTKYLIYGIRYWDNKHFESVELDYLNKKDCGLMFCSTCCMGNYLGRLLDGAKDE
jgi:hypothetical protein